ncbi:MAG: hypothetical protein HZA02_04190 [Nitrospinae bacterium]|nr:hypothetical protein [Nitrospinota bacterium]
MKKENLTGMGALIASGIGGVCCVGPAILAGLGFGAGAASFARGFGVLHVPMTVMALALLGAAFYLRSRKNSVSGEENACCAAAPGNASRRSVFLWMAASLTVVLLLIPYFL